MKRNIFEELKEGFHALEKEREGKVKLKKVEVAADLKTKQEKDSKTRR